MKSLFNIACFILLSVVIFIPMDVSSQSPPPPPSSHNLNGDQPPVGGNAPISDGLIFLLGSAILYAGIKLSARNLHQENHI